MAKKSPLGKGLGALIDNTKYETKSVDEAISTGAVAEIDINEIEHNPFQPREDFDKEALKELEKSIKKHGIIQPITVRKLKNGKFQLIAGERRLRASKSAGLTKIFSFVRKADDQAMLEMALVENIQRKDLDPIEVALSYRQLIEEVKLTQEQLSIRVGKNRSTVTNFLRLLKLDPIIQSGIRDGFLSMGHGRALINISDQSLQMMVYQKIIKDKLSVRQTEQLVKNVKAGKPIEASPAKKKEIPGFVSEGIKGMSSYLGHKIDVKISGAEKGKIIIPFHSEEDFIRIRKLLE